MTTAGAIEPLKVYWRPGCSACLRTKEFLRKHGVPFESVDVQADQESFNELLALGVRRVPIVRRGTDWVDGQVLKDLARIAGVQLGGTAMLSPPELHRRANVLLSAAQRYVRQIPEAELDTQLPFRPRSYRQLAFHAFEIHRFFLDWAETGRRLEFEDYNNEVIDADIRTREDLVGFGAAVQDRLNAWWERDGRAADYARMADVYYGVQTMHEFFERTVWHSGQHTRQLQLVVTKLGLAPDGPLTERDLAGLPMPVNVFDDQLAFG